MPEAALLERFHKLFTIGDGDFERFTAIHDKADKLATTLDAYMDTRQSIETFLPQLDNLMKLLAAVMTPELIDAHPEVTLQFQRVYAATNELKSRASATPERR